MNSDYGSAYASGRARLIEAGVSDAALDARLLLEAVCQTDSSTLYAHPERPLSAQEKDAYDALLTRRAEEKVPLAYLAGTWNFMGMTLHCDERALIPRQDTEFVAEEALKHLHDGMRFLDLCTGSGCIALALAKYTNDTTGIATDLSADAVALAAENAQLTGITNVTFTVCDLYPDTEETYDLIVSNPPYIRTEEIASLQEEIRCHEPQMALDGGADGLDIIRRIIAEAPRHLNRGGYLILETGYDETEAVAARMEEAGFRHVERMRDYAGNPRLVKGCYYV